VSELLLRSATELAALLRAGELSSRELVEASLRRIDALQPKINAFTHVAHEAALAEADAIESGDPRPFAGVPIAIKDNRPVTGMPLTMGSELFGDFVPDHDAYLVRRLREVGFVIVGKTSMPEMGILPTTEPRRFGPTRNPWDTERTPGGSSGGAAAAVAAGMVPVAHGNDGGGSIRIPAACCGLVGLKPARGRVSVGPDGGHSFLVADGVLTRTVRDTARLLDVLSGPEPGDATWAPPPAEPFAALAARAPAKLRIAMTTTPPIPDASVDPACRQAALDGAELLRSLGHEVVEAEVPWQTPGGSELFGAVFSVHISLQVIQSSMVARREASAEDMEPMSWAIYQMAQSFNAVQGAALEVQLQALTRRLVAYLEDYDALLTPALAERPLPIGTLDPAALEPMATFTRSGYFTPFTPIFNASGQPAMSVPLYEGEDRLPLGVQLVGRPADEATLLALAGQLEEASPWRERRPPVS
jgi:amidase